jgi:hypothetical protein
MSRIALLGLLLFGCSSNPPTRLAAPGVNETTSPKESPLAYRVLSDESNRAANTVEYHVIVADQTKHDDVEKLLKFLYRHLMQRREPAPAGLAGYVYSSEAQYRTPPRSPVAQVLQRPGDIGPTFENKVPLEFSQQIDEALPRSDQAWKLAKKVERDDAKKTLCITVPYTEPGKDQWADQLTFNVAMNEFTDLTQALFEKVPELSKLIFVGTWKDEEVAQISLDRATYRALHFADIDEQIGQLHGRAYLEASTHRGSDAELAKANAQRVAAVYKKVLGQLKGHAWVSPKLK